MMGELIRSWGQGRNLLFVLDDFFIGIPLLLTAYLAASNIEIGVLTALIGMAFVSSLAGTFASIYLANQYVR